MNKLGLIAGLSLAVMLPAGAMAAAQHVIAQPDSLEWTAAPPALPKGAQIAVLYGDPGKEGPFVVRLKFPAGYKIPPHMHPSDENVTVISGTLHLEMGDKIDPKQGNALTAGSFVHMPKGTHH